MLETVIRCVVCAVVAVGPVAASATTTLVFRTMDSPFDPGVRNQGWWATVLNNSDDNDNYHLGGAETGGERNFFTFDLSAISAGDVLGATLRLTRFDSGSQNEAFETIRLFDVSTDAATLNHNEGASPEIHADLGSGVSYGTFTVAGKGDAASVFEFALNEAALADIMLAAGGYFSIGGVLISNDGQDSLFAASGTGGIQELVLIVPEPSTGLLLLLGLSRIAARRRKPNQSRLSRRRANG